MRTTLAIDDDALKLAREVARRKRISLGRAASELIRLGARRPLTTREHNGMQLLDLPQDSPTVTSRHVEELLEELP